MLQIGKENTVPVLNQSFESIKKTLIGTESGCRFLIWKIFVKDLQKSAADLRKLKIFDFKILFSTLIGLFAGTSGIFHVQVN